MNLLFLFSILLLNQAPNYPLIINEILFNPPQGGVDFVEIYNPSLNSIDLQQVYLANINSKGDIASIQRISSQPHLMLPGTYRVLTTQASTILSHYPSAVAQNIIEMTRLPAYNNDEGRVILAHYQLQPTGSSTLQIIDSLHYTAKMHTKLIKNPKGISLERQSTDRPTNSPGNFSSAAISSGGATPGYINSSNQPPLNELILHSRIITPYRTEGPLLELTYQITQPDLFATIQIYDEKGRVIKNISRNTSIPSSGTWNWDGLSDQQQQVPTGIYTIFIHLYNTSNYRQVFRKSFVLTY